MYLENKKCLTRSSSQTDSNCAKQNGSPNCSCEEEFTVNGTHCEGTYEIIIVFDFVFLKELLGINEIRSIVVYFSD